MFTELEVHKAIDAACDVLRGGWCKYALVLDINGRETTISQGVSFCAVGALRKAGANTDMIMELDKRSLKIANGWSISSINDSAENRENVMLFLQSLKKDLPKT